MASEAIIAAHTAQCVNLLTAWLAKLLLLRTQLSVLAQHQFFLYIIIVSLTMSNVWQIKFHIYESITIKVIYFIYDLENIASEVNEYKLKHNTDD